MTRGTRLRAIRDRRDETLPTVRIGDQALVSPPPGCIIKFDPSLVGPTGGRALSAEPLRVAQWVVISLLIAVSLAVDTTCHPTLSAGADVTAVVVYVALGSLRMWLARRESDDRVVLEGNLYFPLEDVNMEFLYESHTYGLFVEGGSELLHRPCGRCAEYRCALALPASVAGDRQGRVLAGSEGDPLGR